MENNGYGCRADQTKEEDNDSLIDKCWEAQYKGDSRKWLIRDGSYKKPKGPLISSMKAAYTYPVDNKSQWEILGKRKSSLLQKFYEEATQEVIQERNAPPEVEDYCTEYDSNYKLEGFEVDDEPHTKLPELYEKYPLYSTVPTTYYSHNLQNQYPKPYIPGLSSYVDRKSPFKRCSGFTTPLHAKLDDRIW